MYRVRTWFYSRSCMWFAIGLNWGFFVGGLIGRHHG